MSTLVTTNLKNPSNPGNNLVLEANGSVLFSAGTATVPSISFTGDLNTGIYSPGADQVAISTGGSGRLFVDASGRVGVGSAPSVGNGIHATINTNNYGTALVLQNANVNGWAAEMQFLGITTTDTQAKIGALATGPGTNSGALAFYTANAGSYLERLRITSAGLVGIGTSSPVAPLHVSGSGVFARLTDTQAYSFGTSGPILDFTGNDSSGASILFARLQGSPANGGPDRGFLNIFSRHNGITRSTLQVGTGFDADVLVPNGRLGIGTTSPGYALHVSGTGAVSSRTFATDATGDASFFVQNDGNGICGPLVYGSTKTAYGALASNETAFYSNRSTTIMADGGSAVIKFATGGNTERARIDSSGNVGIGTSSPASLLSVVKAAEGTSLEALRLVNESPNQRSTSSVYIGMYGSNEAYERARILCGNPTDFDGNNGFLSFWTRNTGTLAEKVRIDNAGRLGIGTTSPAYPLHVVGAITSRNATADMENMSIGFTETGSGLNYSVRIGQKANTVLAFEKYDGAWQETVRIDGSGRVGIGTTSPGYALDTRGAIASTSASGIQTVLSFASDGIVGTVSNHSLTFFANNGERARIDTSGRLLVGTSSARNNFYNSSSYSPRLQLESANSGANSSIALTSVSGGGFDEPNLVFAKSRGSAIGDNTIVASGDDIGNISFQASDGSEFVVAANILAEVDGTPGANDMPGRLVFSTTADGASSPTERMRISQNGTVTINGPGGGTFLNLSNSGGYSGFHEVDNTAYTIGQNSDLRAMRIGSGANWLTTGVNLAPGGTSWGTYSDERLKTDIVELTDCLNDIKGIRCVSYRLTDVDDVNSKKRIGVIAQDLVGKYDQAINASRRSENDETEYLSVQYSDLIPVLLKALQEASVKIESLESRLTAAGI